MSILRLLCFEEFHMDVCITREMLHQFTTNHAAYCFKIQSIIFSYIYVHVSFIHIYILYIFFIYESCTIKSLSSSFIINKNDKNIKFNCEKFCLNMIDITKYDMFISMNAL